MRSTSRRSFTVEVKASGRRHATLIPSRVATPAAAPPRAFLAAPTGSSAPAAEKRRILPNLIAPEPQRAEPEPMADAAERPPQRRRGRPRKLPPAEPVAASVAAVEEVAPVAPPPADTEPRLPARAPRRPAAAPGDALAPGERWKRRLGRWSR